jgi:hypothetical protein
MRLPLGAVLPVLKATVPQTGESRTSVGAQQNPLQGVTWEGSNILIWIL